MKSIKDLVLSIPIMPIQNRFSSRSTCKMAQKFQVVIVGAGLSGLRAAREVHNAGLSYIVLEAMDRVGGKTLSVHASDGHGAVDLGASWINDTSQSEIYKLAKEFGFDLVEQRTEGNSLYRDEMGQVHCIPFEMPAKVSLSCNFVNKSDHA